MTYKRDIVFETALLRWQHVGLQAAQDSWSALWQGVLAGLLGLWAFGVAIVRLGAAPAAAFAALVPAVSALGGWWWLDEALTMIDLLAISAAVVSVALASGAMPLVTPASASRDPAEARRST